MAKKIKRADKSNWLKPDEPDAAFEENQLEKAIRLDQYLIDNHHADSRSRAQDLVKLKHVYIDGVLAKKAAQKIMPDMVVDVRDAHDFVSRGALKMVRGLTAFNVDPKDKICVDMGACTGGFSEVLLRQGAKLVYAVDVGHGQLHDSLKDHPCLFNMEKMHGKDITARAIPDPIDILVCDVSFISLTKCLGPSVMLCKPGADIVVLIKPQFEVGRRYLRTGGIVKTDYDYENDLLPVIKEWFTAQGCTTIDIIDSPILGGDGNREFLLHATKNEQ